MKKQNTESNTGSSKRLVSLDVLRGITVAGMILVNDGYGDTFVTLQHSKWNGMTPCDLVFPFFLFIMGISTYISLRKYQFQATAQVIRKIFRRTVVIFAIGLLINWFALLLKEGFSLEHLRIMGVMQRIALCYCAASFFAIFVNHRYTLPVVFAILIAYTLVLALGNGYAQDASNIAARIDNAILGYDHLYHKSAVDPEGLLGTLPAIAHTLIGFFCGKLMMETKDKLGKVTMFLLVGGILIIAGYLLQYGMPLNKRIWSPSYVLMTCGLCATMQGILMWIIDIQGRRGWTMPFLVFGMNPLFLYVLSELMAIAFGNCGVNDWIYGVIHSVVSNTYLASLCYALTYVLTCGLVGYPLYRKKIYIKI
ncbi:MAG: DUF1624 domain-containing protein [Prevotella sp.]|nr:DUF1624 domain-containing protein [Prevotella sp.]